MERGFFVVVFFVCLFLSFFLLCSFYELPCQLYFILFYSLLGYVLPLQEVALCQSRPSFSVLCNPPCCPTMSSLQPCFGLLTDFIPSACHSVLLIVHLLSFIQAMCPAHFHFHIGYVLDCVFHSDALPNDGVTNSVFQLDIKHSPFHSSLACF